MPPRARFCAHGAQHAGMQASALERTATKHCVGFPVTAAISCHTYVHAARHLDGAFGALRRHGVRSCCGHACTGCQTPESAHVKQRRQPTCLTAAPGSTVPLWMSPAPVMGLGHTPGKPLVVVSWRLYRASKHYRYQSEPGRRGFVGLPTCPARAATHSPLPKGSST